MFFCYSCSVLEHVSAVSTFISSCSKIRLSCWVHIWTCSVFLLPQPGPHGPPQGSEGQTQTLLLMFSRSFAGWTSLFRSKHSCSDWFHRQEVDVMPSGTALNSSTPVLVLIGSDWFIDHNCPFGGLMRECGRGQWKELLSPYLICVD